MLIFDLDDTIFETRSIDPNILSSTILLIDKFYEEIGLDSERENLIADLWQYPIDVVFSKYKTPQVLITEIYNSLDTIDHQTLKLETFDDYEQVRYLPHEKLLVTSGIKELQMTKIRALRIESDFKEIYIDDPRSNPRTHKLNIFESILGKSKLKADQIWVIGDNPESEIKAGRILGMNTIQRRSKNKIPSEFADYVIESFDELQSIVYR